MAVKEFFEGREGVFTKAMTTFSKAVKVDLVAVKAFFEGREGVFTKAVKAFSKAVKSYCFWWRCLELEVKQIIKHPRSDLPAP